MQNIIPAIRTMDVNSTPDLNRSDQQEPNNNTCISRTLNLNDDQNSVISTRFPRLKGCKEECQPDQTASSAVDCGNGVVQEKSEPQPIEVPATSMSQKRFQCRMCTLSFSKRWNCLSHMRAHTRVRHIFHCPTCHKKCSKQSELEIHIRIHTGEKPHMCSVCQRSFVRRGQLNAHSRIHTGDKPHMCDDCGAFFASSSNLRRHQQCHAKARAEDGVARQGKIHIIKRQRSRVKAAGCEEEGEVGGRGREEVWSKPGPFPTRVVINRHNTPALHNIAAPPLQQQPPSEDFSAACSNVATNTDYDIITNRVSTKEEPLKSEMAGADVIAVSSAVGSQVIPVPIKAIPAMAAQTAPLLLVDPVIEELLDERKIHITEGNLHGDRHKMQQAPITVSDASAVQVAAEALVQGEVTDGGEGQITLVAESEPSSAALSSVMQMDWSFLLEDTGLPAPSTSLETLPESLSQSQTVLSLAGAVPVMNSTETRLPDPNTASHVQGSEHPVNDAAIAQVSNMSYQLSIPADAAVAGSNVFEVNSSSMSVGSPVFQLNGSCLPLIVPIPHMPAVDSSQLQQGDEVAQAELQNISTSRPVTLVVEQLHPDQYQVVQEIPGDASCADGTQLVLDSQGFSQTHTITLLPHTTFIDTPTTDTPTTDKPTPPLMTKSSTAVPPAKPASAKKAATKPAKLFVCDVCQQRFSRQWYLTVHRTTHFRPDTFPCNLCGAQFSRLGNLNRHKRSHTGAKPFQCSTCPSRFGSKYRLIEHERRHEGFKPYMCETCSCSFSDCSSLKRHQQAHKGDNLQHTCEVCGAQFRTLHSLSFHMRMHKSEGWSDKGITRDESESTPRDMPIVTVNQAHEAVEQTPCVLKQMTRNDQVTTTRYLCSVCHKTFQHSAACRQHILCHTGSRPFKCTDCGAKFSRKADAKRHTLTHRREKRHLCSACGDKFQTLSRLVLHQETHRPAQERPFPCQECGESFSKERVVQIHAQIHHHRRHHRYQSSKLSSGVNEGEGGKQTSSIRESGGEVTFNNSDQDGENLEPLLSVTGGTHKMEGDGKRPAVEAEDRKTLTDNRQDRVEEEDGGANLTTVGEKRRGCVLRKLASAKADECRMPTVSKWGKKVEGGTSSSAGGPNLKVEAGAIVTVSVKKCKGEKARKLTAIQVVNAGKLLTISVDKKPKMLTISGNEKNRTLTAKKEERRSKGNKTGRKVQSKPSAGMGKGQSGMRLAGSGKQWKGGRLCPKGRQVNGVTSKISEQGLEVVGKDYHISVEISEKRNSHDSEVCGLPCIVQEQRGNSNASMEKGHNIKESFVGCGDFKSETETCGNRKMKTNTHEHSNADEFGDGKSNTDMCVNRQFTRQSLERDYEKGFCVDDSMDLLMKQNTQSLQIISHNTFVSEEPVSTKHTASRNKHQITTGHNLLISKQPKAKSSKNSALHIENQTSANCRVSQNEQPLRTGDSVLVDKQQITINKTARHIDQPITNDISALHCEEPLSLPDGTRPLRAAAKKQRTLLASLAPKQRARKNAVV